MKKAVAVLVLVLISVLFLLSPLGKSRRFWQGFHKSIN